MQTFEKTIRVVADDLDDLKHVNNVRFVQWIQDISKAHWQAYAPKEIQDEVVWVVMNHNITYKGEALLHDEIKIRTYIAESHGATSVRAVEMHNAETGKLLLTSKTAWCLLNAKTGKPMRISDKIRGIFLSEKEG